MTSGEAKLNGIVLAGGKSLRMGHDKGSIAWHGLKQREYLAKLLKPLCNEVYISCRQGQEIDSEYPLLTDTVTDMGPLGAILSAFEKQPGTAWLVVACDLPLMDEATLKYLIDNRDRNAIATTFESPHDGLSEPLITIWEPAAYALLQSHIGEGFKCPRKALIKSDNVRVLKAPYPDALINANTPEDAAKAEDIINKKVMS